MNKETKMKVLELLHKLDMERASNGELRHGIVFLQEALRLIVLDGTP